MSCSGSTQFKVVGQFTIVCRSETVIGVGNDVQTLEFLQAANYSNIGESDSDADNNSKDKSARLYKV
jgi:hypothetical protein